MEARGQIRLFLCVCDSAIDLGVRFVIATPASPAVFMRGRCIPGIHIQGSKIVVCVCVTRPWGWECSQQAHCNCCVSIIYHPAAGRGRVLLYCIWWFLIKRFIRMGSGPRTRARMETVVAFCIILDPGVLNHRSWLYDFCCELYWISSCGRLKIALKLYTRVLVALLVFFFHRGIITLYFPIKDIRKR